MMTLNL